MTRDQPITALVADDHPAVLDSLARYLRESGIDVIGTARGGKETLEKIEARCPTVALVDVRLPELSGIEIVRLAARSAPSTAIILYTGYGEQALLTEALDAGARGFVLKEAPLPDLVRAIEMVAGGATYVDPALGGTIVKRSDTLELTRREREVLRLLAEGLSNAEIGKRLYISAETVRTHIRKACAKLGCTTRTQAVAKALRDSLIS